MREYNNRDKKSNDLELDPCLAAEIRMKKGILTPRTRRTLLALLAVLLLIILLSLLLYYLLSRPVVSRDAQPQTSYADYDVFDSVEIAPAIDPTVDHLTQATPSRRGIGTNSPTTATVKSKDEEKLRNYEEPRSRYSTEKPIFITVAPVPVVPIVFPASGVENTESSVSSTYSTVVMSSSVLTTSTTDAKTTTTSVLSTHPIPMDEPELPLRIIVHDETAEDCVELHARGMKNTGVYRLSLPRIGEFEAVCDMVTKGGGWTLIQRRQDGSVYFENRTWDEYVHGFGSPSSSFWLGLDKIYALVAKEKGRPLTLRIEIRGDYCSEGDRCSNLPDGFWWGEWDFKISDASRNYKLTLSPATAGNLTEHTGSDKFFYMNNGKQFTAIDRDNDNFKEGNCAQFRDFGGWWHHDCGYVALNGRYGDTSARWRNMYWFYSVGRNPTITYYIKPRHSIMMVRPKSKL